MDDFDFWPSWARSRNVIRVCLARSGIVLSIPSLGKSLNNLYCLISTIITNNNLKMGVINGNASLKDPFGHLFFVIERQMDGNKGMAFKLNILQRRLKPA